MKVKRILAVIVSIIAIFSVFTFSVFADNTVSSGQQTEAIRPIARIEGIANSQNGRYGSMYDITATALFTDSDLSNQQWIGNLTQGSSWIGFDTGTHTNSHTANFQHLVADDTDFIQSYIEMGSFNNLDNYDIQIYYDDISVDGEYYTYANEYNVGEFIVLGSSNVNAIQEINVYWWQYELDQDTSDVRYVQKSYSRMGTIADYGGIKEGNRIYLPVIDLSVDSCREALSENIGLVEAGGVIENSTIQINKLRVELTVNGLNHFAVTQVYDWDNNVERPQGDRIEIIDNRIDVDNFDFVSFITNGVGGFLNFQIIPGLSLSVILGGLLAILLLKSILRIFAGG